MRKEIFSREKGIICLLVVIIVAQQLMMLMSSSSGLNEESLFVKTSSSNLKSKSTENGLKPFKAFNRTNPHGNSWCPGITCNNSPVCSPCNRRYLFIIATGRSGSTTLLKMLNQLPNVRLSGENWNILYRASMLIKTFENNPTNFIDQKTSRKGYFMHDAVLDGPFMHNAMPLGSISCVMQSLIKFLDPPPFDPISGEFDENDESKKILGVKVIRLQQSNWTTTRAMKFLTKSFPCTRYIINTRSDYMKQGESMIHAFGKTDMNEIVPDIQAQTEFLHELAKKLGNKRAKLIDMVAWSEDISILNDILDWLGFENCAFSSVIHENHDNFGNDNTVLSLGKDCRYPFV